MSRTHENMRFYSIRDIEDLPQLSQVTGAEQVRHVAQRLGLLFVPLADDR